MPAPHWQAALQEATDLRNNLPHDPRLMTGRLQVSELLSDGVRIDAGNPAISPWAAAGGDVYLYKSLLFMAPMMQFDRWSCFGHSSKRWCRGTSPDSLWKPPWNLRLSVRR